MGATVRRYMMDLGAQYEVAIQEREGGRYAIGLPLMRPGTWNGVTYTADDLRAMADNHAIIAAQDLFEPGLKPNHAWEVDARDVMGWWTALRYDEEQELLVGDLRITDDDLVEAMASGTLRYLSAEVLDGYTLQDGRDIGKALVGAAWVDWPGVRGLPEWKLVMNRAEWENGNGEDGNVRPRRHGEHGVPRRTADGEDCTVVETDAGYMRHGYSVGNGTEVSVDRDGVPVRQTWVAEDNEEGTVMSFAERLKGLLGRLGASAEDLAALEAPDDVGQGEGDEHGAEPMVHRGAPHPAPAEPTSERPAVSDGRGDSMVVAQLAQERRAREEMEARVRRMEDERRVERAGAMVDDLVRSGHVMPSQRQGVLVLTEALMRRPETVTLHREGTEPQQADLVAVLRETLQARQVVAAEPRGIAWYGSEDPQANSDEDARAAGERMAAIINGTEEN